MTLVAGLAAVVALAAAVRSTWSPCGLSMLSTLTPLAERSRGHRYGITALWFVLGATVGGATTGLVAAALAVGLHAAGLTTTTAEGLAAGLALLCAGSDLHPFGWSLPSHGRQVNELWLSQYRPWVYASGFGWQIGTGLATYIMTAAVYLLVALAGLTAAPVIALGLVTLFGFVRGLAVLLSWRIDRPERLHAFHRRFDQLGPTVRIGTIAVQLVVAVVAAWAAWGAAAVGIVALIGIVTAALAQRQSARPPQPARAAVRTPEDGRIRA
jgi:hypothetical protein